MDVRRHRSQPGSPDTGEAATGGDPDERAGEDGPGAASPDALLVTLDESQLQVLRRVVWSAALFSCRGRRAAEVADRPIGTGARGGRCCTAVRGARTPPESAARSPRSGCS